MKRRWKIAIGVLVGLIVLLVVNSIVVNGETKGAKTTVADGKIVQAFGGDVQVTDNGPKSGSPIVLIHCYTCSLSWWDGILPLLDKEHRVIRVDLLGHGGSEKPAAGYSIENQAETIASVLSTLGIQHATVVGHSLGFTVATALAEKSPELVGRLIDIDQAPSNRDFGNSGVLQDLSYVSGIGEALWRITPDFMIRSALKKAFAPGFNLAAGFQDPDQPVHDLREMTYTAYADSHDAENSYTSQTQLSQRLQALAKPLLVVFGTEDQIYDATKAANAYKNVPGAQIQMIQGAGHSPNVEKPAETAALILEFAATPNNPTATPAKPEFKPPNKGKLPAKKRPARKQAVKK